MMEELATVVAIDLISSQCSKITVESQIKSTCSSCHQIDSCGSGQVSKALPKKSLIVELTTELPVKLGDVVVLGLSEKGLLQTAWQVYLWPLIGLIIFSGIGQYLVLQVIFTSEIYAIILGCIGGYLGHRLARFWQTYSKASLALMPKILRVNEMNLNVIHLD
tara:strand:+ start:1401 stop:1889 length:489 start_codon:yes stop_codon:yes gene_type:complete